MVTQALVPGLPPTHIGIHCGPVVFQDGDIYRSTVNIAARLSARAAPGEVLVSKPVADRIVQPSWTVTCTYSATSSLIPGEGAA